MKSLFAKSRLALVCVVAASAPFTTARAVSLQQIISHENPAFNAGIARLTAGADGNVYLFHARSTAADGYMMRVRGDGTGKGGATIHYSANGVAANSKGQYVVAEAHFQHSATVYGRDFASGGAFNEFNNENYDSPQWVEAGASDDFYAADLRGNRIVRVSPTGKKIAVYPVKAGEFRVSEKNQQFYVNTGSIDVYGFDGKKLWDLPIRVGGDIYNGFRGGYDVDDQGVLYVAAANSDKIQAYAPDGKPLREITLQMGEFAPGAESRIMDLRVAAGDLFIKRNSPTELFQRYDKATGARKNVVSIDFDRLTADYPDRTWTAGKSVPFKIGYTPSAPSAAPHWRVWARTFGAPKYREWSLKAGELQIPSDAAGLYQIKVSPEVDPGQRRVATEYLVRDIVQVLAPGSKGTVNAMTPDNRVYYGRGEAIPVSILVRAPAGNRPARVNLRLLHGKTVLAQGAITVPATGAGQLTIPAALTAALRPGDYLLQSDTAGLTNVPQEIIIGEGTAPDSAFLRIQYGDYGTDMPYFPLTPFDAPEVTSFYAERSKRLGLNMVAERAGSSSLSWDADKAALLAEVTGRLEKDETGIAPEKAKTAAAFLQTAAAYSAGGIHYTPILLGNDASTTLGVGLDPRKPEVIASELTKVTNALLPYPAFRGWDWAANWWAQEHGVDAAKTPEQKKAYNEALAKARSTGEWNPVLDEVSDLWLQKAPETTKSFNDTLAGLTRAKKTAVSAPYRNVYAYPPVTFKNVDEVDLQFQAEQMYVPYGFLHNTDFYKRPGKRAWAHPELWNDSGTGEQILRELFGMTMRGVDGAGFSGSPGWWGNKGLTDDPRLAYNGTMSVYRAAFNMLRDYGPWLATLQNNDRVAIVASPRMFRLDEWGSIYGTHFARVKEAFTACLHAHYPASIVFVDDMKPDTLKKYKAVLVVGQRVELEPMLTTALQAAKAAGTTVFYDGTCREELVKQYTPLGLSFNHFETDKHTWGDDPAFWQGRFPGYVMQDVPALKAKLGAVMKPVAETDNPEVLASERTAGQGRYIFVLNGTTPQIDPSQLWRQSLFVATRVPVTAPVTLNAEGGTVYDMTAMKPVSHNGVVNADLRASPLRVYAVLPAPIAGLGLRGPTTVGAGGSFAWGAWVQDAGGRSLEAAIPVRLRLLAADGRTLGEANAAAFSKAGAQGSFTVPLDMPAGALTLEATELVSGKSARLRVTVTAATLPLGLGNPALPKAETGTEGKGAPATSADPAPVMDFGPHIRDTILLGNGGVAVMNVMNWDSNLYGVDTATGKVLWKGRTGQAFTYAPQPVQGGFAVQGFDFDSPSGYHLYLADAAGKATRRFPLYGLGRRLPQRFLASLLNDRMNHFAAAPDGSWVASYGDLGLAVWDRGGKLLWQQDDWKQTHTGPRWRGTAGWNDAFLTTPTVAPLDAATLLVIKDLTATAYDAASGARKWQAPLASAGQAVKVQSSDDGKTIAVLSTTEGGRVFLLRGGKLVKTIAATGEDMGFAGDGSAVAVVNSTQLKLYGADGGLRWVHNGDEILVNPRIAADGRVAACSRLGTLYVLDAAGNILLQRDMGALVAPAWLPGGDLLASGWMGTVVRLAGDGYTEKWRTRLVPAQADMRGKLLEADPVPAAALPDWTNEAAKAAPLSPNLLAQTRAAVTVSINNQKVLLPFSIYDGKPEAPQKPWAAWNDVNWLGEGTAQNYIEMEMRGYDATVTGITLVEDAARPSSWLRDVYLQYWDPKTEDWGYALTLLSNSATHTHMLPKPVSASRWRLMLPPGAVTNVSLGEIVLHGTATDQFFPDGQLVKTVADLPGNERFIWEDGLPTGVWKGATVVTEVPGTKPKTGTQALLLAGREALGATGEWTKAPWTAPVAWPVGTRLKGWYYLPADQAGEPTLRLEVGLAHGDYAYTLANLKKGQWQEFSLSPDMLKNAKGETMDGTRAYPVLALKLFPEGTTTLYADSLRIE